MVGCDKAVLLDRFVIYIALPMSFAAGIGATFFQLGCGIVQKKITKYQLNT